MGPDYEKYRPLLGDFDLTDAQKDDLLITMWSIMDSFIDRKFGNDPVQQVTCRQDFEKSSKNLGIHEKNKVRSQHTNRQGNYKELDP